MDRKDRLQKFIEDNSSDVFCTTLQPDLIYFADYFGEGIYLFERGRDILIVNSLYYEDALKNSKVSEVLLVKNNLIHKFLRERFPKGTVFLISENESISMLKTLKKAGLKVIVKDTQSLRLRKEESEVELIREAYRILEKAIINSLSVVREGVKELDVAAEICYQIRKEGAEGESFNPIVVFGEKTSMPHARTGVRKLKKGDIVLIDAGARYKGYCSDITRCFSFGNNEKEVRMHYKLLKDASDKALEAIFLKERKARKIDASARKILKKAGLGDNFIHNLGHGIGLEVHELPRLGPKSKDILEDGMVFTIEPGVYFNGKYGLRLEDCIYLKDEPIVLTKLPAKIMEI